MLMGDALGRAMIDLMNAAAPVPFVWTQTAGNAQSWTTGANWAGGSVPVPAAGDIMDFSSVDILANTSLTLGADRTAQHWKFGDTAGAETWTVNAGHSMILAGETPTIQVNNNTAALNCPLAGASGFTKRTRQVANRFFNFAALRLRVSPHWAEHTKTKTHAKARSSRR